MLIYIFIMLAVFLLTERLFPAMAFAKVANWYGRALMVNLLSVGIQILAGLTWENWLNAFSLMRLQDYMAAPVAAISAYILKTFFDYWWHRLRHISSFLWRTVHQLHHSPARLETLTAFYVHPFDFIAQSILGAVIMFTVFGFDVNAVGWYVMVHAFVGFFIHSNIAGVPRWVGYVIQTPTMHRIHHEYDSHNYNFGDVVWWDMIFGTYRNNRARVERCGFDENLELRVADMIVGRDVHEEQPVYKTGYETFGK